MLSLVTWLIQMIKVIYIYLLHCLLIAASKFLRLSRFWCRAEDLKFSCSLNYLVQTRKKGNEQKNLWLVKRELTLKNRWVIIKLFSNYLIYFEDDRRSLTSEVSLEPQLMMYEQLLELVCNVIAKINEWINKTKWKKYHTNWQSKQLGY